MDGFYSNRGVPGPGGFTPSGYLLKAVLLNGAVALQGFSDEGLIIEPWGERPPN